MNGTTDLRLEGAREYGHTHVDEIAAAADRFQNEAVLLIHFSARYKVGGSLSLHSRAICFIRSTFQEALIRGVKHVLVYGQTLVVYQYTTYI